MKHSTCTQFKCKKSLFFYPSRDFGIFLFQIKEICVIIKNNKYNCIIHIQYSKILKKTQIFSEN